MSQKTRDNYFNLQDGVRIVLQKRESRWPLDNINMGLPKGKDRLMEHLRPGEKWKLPKEVLSIANSSDISAEGDDVPDEVFEELRKLGSRLRSSMADDVRTRTASVLNEQAQAESEADPTKPADRA